MRQFRRETAFGLLLSALSLAPAQAVAYMVSEARMLKLHAGIHLFAAPDLFSPTKPDCQIPGRTEIVKPLSDDGNQLDMECIVSGTLTITEYGARAAFVHAKVVRDTGSPGTSVSKLYYIHTHKEANCREMTRRYTHDWYMNRLLRKSQENRRGGTQEATEWNKGTYFDIDQEWSKWETISSALSPSEKYLCSKWETMKNARFSS